jgi:hypothetical protein
VATFGQSVADFASTYRVRLQYSTDPIAMPIRACLAGATGWAGSELTRAIVRQKDLTLVAAISRTHAGRNLGEVLGDPQIDCLIYASAREALMVKCDVFVEYTKPDSAKHNILTALEQGAHVVVGTSSLTDDDFVDIDVIARRQNRAVLACGNFALTVRSRPWRSIRRSVPTSTRRNVGGLAGAFDSPAWLRDQRRR